jgi:hypothetical protein
MVRHILPCFVWVEDSRVKHTVQIERHIVCRDRALTWYFYCHFLQTLDIRYPVQKWYQDCQPWLQHSLELAHALHDPCCLLWHKTDDRIRW